jgi:hypothetical protein
MVQSIVKSSLELARRNVKLYCSQTLGKIGACNEIFVCNEQEEIEAANGHSDTIGDIEEVDVINEEQKSDGINEEKDIIVETCANMEGSTMTMLKKVFNMTPAVPTTNVLLNYKSLQLAMKEFSCPNCMKQRKTILKPDNYRTLQLSQFTNGFASVVTITCKSCKVEIATIEPQHQQSEFEGRGSKGTFMKYAINYFAVVMMQCLGMSLEGLAMMLAFIGLAPGIGGKKKWRHI